MLFNQLNIGDKVYIIEVEGNAPLGYEECYG